MITEIYDRPDGKIAVDRYSGRYGLMSHEVYGSRAEFILRAADVEKPIFDAASEDASQVAEGVL